MLLYIIMCLIDGSRGDDRAYFAIITPRFLKSIFTAEMSVVSTTIF